MGSAAAFSTYSGKSYGLHLKLDRANEALTNALEALAKCRDDNSDDPPPGDQCPLPEPSPEDLKPTVPYKPGWTPNGFPGIDWGKVGALAAVGGAGVVIAAAVIASGGTLGLAMAAGVGAGLLGDTIISPPGGILFSFPGPLELSDSPVPNDLFIAPALPPLEIVSRDPAPLVFE